MFISDGMLLLETFTYKTPVMGVGVLIGTGTVPDLATLFANCKASDGTRTIINTTLSTYLTSISANLILDTTYADVTVSLSKSKYFVGFAYSAFLPVMPACTPTWIMICRPPHDQAALTSGNSWLTNVSTSRCVMLFTMGYSGSGADIVYGSAFTANSSLYLPNLTLPISNVVS